MVLFEIGRLEAVVSFGSTFVLIYNGIGDWIFDTFCHKRGLALEKERTRDLIHFEHFLNLAE